jgi:site-specific recombinase XerD
MAAIVTTIHKSEPDTIQTLVERWLNQGLLDGLSGNTIERYRNTLGKFLWWWETYHAPRLGQHPRFVSVHEAGAYLAYVRESRKDRWGLQVAAGKEQLKPNAIVVYTAPVVNFFNWLEQNSYIEVNPFNNRSLKSSFGRGRKKLSAAQVEDVSDENLKKLLSHISTKDYTAGYSGTRNRAIILLLLDSGMRRGELLSMTVGNLNMATMRCSITGKTGPRTVFFSQATSDALKAYWQRYRQHQPAKPDSPYWLTSDGETLAYSTLGGVFTKLEKELNIKSSAHQLRHSFATRMQGKVSLFELMSMLGHASVRTTQKYVHPNQDGLAKAYQGNSPLSNPDLLPKAEKRRRGRPRSKPQ